MNGIALLSAACVVADCGYNQVRAVSRNHTRLRQTAAGIRLLNRRVDGQSRDDDAESQVERDEELVQGASVAGEESVHDTGEGNGTCVERKSGPDEDPLP